MTNKITIIDIANEAKVAPSTVSRVLAGKTNVSEATRTLVQEIARKYNFVTGANARAQASRAQKTIALILPEINDHYSDRILCSANREAQNLGYHTMLFQFSKGRDGEMKEIADQVIDSGLKGALFAGGVHEANRRDIPEALRVLIEQIPFIAISPPIEGMNCTFLHCDLVTGFFQSVQHLKMLGHERIAFIGGQKTMQSSGARVQGYLRGIEELNLVHDDAYYVGSGFNAESGEMAILRMFANLPKRQWPTAIVAFCDMVALGAIGQLHRMGLRVPEDVALVGCDNAYFSPYILPPLTTIDMHAEERARTAITEIITNPTTSKIAMTQLRAPSLIIRESCGAKAGGLQPRSTAEPA